MTGDERTLAVAPDARTALAPLATRRAALEAMFPGFPGFPGWVPRTLDQLLDVVAEAHPDRPYVITDDRTWTYRELQEWSLRIAAGLQAAGVRPGEHVAFVLGNFPEFVALKFAIARVGAVAVPINFLNRRDELGYILRQSDSVLLVTMDTFRDLDYLRMLDELAPGWATGGGGAALPELRRVVVFPTAPGGGRAGATTFAELAEPAAELAPISAPDAESDADIIYTSGTTGTPKGVLLTHDMLLRTAYGSAYGRGFQDGRRIVFSLPMYHVYGYVEGMLSVLMAGGAIIPRLAFTAADTLAAIERHRADDALLIPLMTMDVIEEQRRAVRDLSSLTSVLSSGGHAPPWIWDAITEVLAPEEITTGYGMSETTASTTVTSPDDPRERLLTTNGRLRDVGQVGDPALEGRLALYRVLDDDGRDVPLGEVGELVCMGPSVTAGYYKKPDETAAAFTPDGWLRSGDLGRMDAQGYITLVGRKKECYRCGGEQVMPKEIEDVLLTHTAVGQAHVAPLPDERMGEVGVAFIVPKPGAVVDTSELTDYCAERLARFKVPRHVLALAADEVPLTPSGRPRKFLLTERAQRELADSEGQPL